MPTDVITLIFNGSPHPRGDTAALISEFSDRLGGEITEYRAYDMDVGPCVDCRVCWREPRCAIDDGMQRIYGDIIAADNIVIASPLYFSTLTGPLMSMMSRLQYFYAQRRFLGEERITKRKQGGALLVGGGDGSAQRAIDLSKTMLKHMRAEYLGCVLSHATDDTPAREDGEALAGARALADAMRAPANSVL